MNKSDFFSAISENYNVGDNSGIKNTIKDYLNNTPIETASKNLAEYIYHNYTSYKRDAMAGLMQIAIECNPEIALIKFPENYLFQLVIKKGSVDLYECYIEDAVEPFLADKDEDFIFDYYAELQLVAQELNDRFFPQYVPCFKGLDFNGIFSHLEEKPGISLIHTNDFEIMDSVVEEYNSIIGRRDILADLEKKIYD